MDIKQTILDLLSAPDYLPLTLSQWLAEPIFDQISPQKVQKAFSDLERDFQIILTKKGKVLPFTDSGLVPALFRASTRGFGFADHTASDGTIHTYFIPAHSRKHAIHLDTVLIRILSKGNGQEEGEAEVERILSHTLKEAVGVIVRQTFRNRRKAPIYTFLPDDARLGSRMEILPKKGQSLKGGEKAVLRFLRFPSAMSGMAGEITKIFGKSDTMGANYEAILYANGIRQKFPKPALAQGESMRTLPLLTEGRLDLTKTDRYGVIFTMDGADAKDLDDAISLCLTADNHFLLGVHIADVSEYVNEGSPLDEEAFLRGCSVYFTDKVVPMLPASLSNGICSLYANEKRYALSVFMEIDREGNLLRSEFHRSVICSSLRGVYEEFNDLLENGVRSPYFEKYAILGEKTSENLCTLCDLLTQRHQANGMLELVSEESHITLNEDGEPIAVTPRQTGRAEKIIEQCMLSANEAVARLAKEKGIPCIYRVHATPPQEKLSALALFANHCNLPSSFSTDPAKIQPQQLRSFFEEAKACGYEQAVSVVLLRSLSKASYSPTPALHFGLATEPYCHFTSPIRRYPDLCVHRFLKAYLFGDWDEKKKRHFTSVSQKASIQSSETELRALNAEREIEALYKMRYLSHHVGEVFWGTIRSITAFGIFVLLENSCEGMITVEDLDEYALFDEASLSIRIGRNVYHLCDSVAVKLLDVDIENRKATLRLLRKETAPKKGDKA